MRILVIINLLLFMLVSCNKSNIVEDKSCQEYNIDNYKFCIPNNWINKKNTSYDSRNLVFINKEDSIIISDGDTNIVDDPVLVNSEKEKQTLIDFSNGELSSKDVIIYQNKDFDISHSIYLKNYYYYDKINNIDVLLIFPKKQEGTIGAIFNKNSKEKKLSIYCNNPSIETQQAIRKLLKTVKIN